MDLISRLSEIKFKTADVPAPELGDDYVIRVRELSGSEQLTFHSMLSKDNANEIKALAYALMCALVDENGQRQLKTQDEAESVVKLLPGKLFQRINKAIFELNNGEAEKKL